MNLFSLLRPVVVVLLAAGSVTIPAGASGEERDFVVHGTAHFVDGPNFVGAGNATQMGLYSEVGQAFISGDNPFALEVSGW